jgi:hypothetical protein
LVGKVMLAAATKPTAAANRYSATGIAIVDRMSAIAG